MNGTTVVLNAPDPTAINTQATITPGRAAPLSMAAGNEVANSTVAPIASILDGCQHEPQWMEGAGIG